MDLDYKIRYCPKCGHIEILTPELRPVCDYCGSSLNDTEYEFLDSIDKGNLKREIEIAIKDKYINNATLSKEAVEEKNKIKEFDLLHGYGTVSNSNNKNVPKCPTCGSTNIDNISTVKKAVGFAAVGIFSSNLGKTMECKNCGYKW